MAKGIAFKYTEEMKKFIHDNQYGISRKELSNLVNEKFNVETTEDLIKGYCARNKLKSSNNGQFKKGDIPINKGKKVSPEIYEKCKNTMFKKGNIPKCYKPVGSERISRDGYIEIKVADPNKWQLKHRFIWENINGKIPDDCVIIFADRDKRNINIDNLMMISRIELVRMNQNNLFSNNAELTKTGLRIAKLINGINAARKKE